MIKNIWIKNELERRIEIEDYIGKRNNEAIEIKGKNYLFEIILITALKIYHFIIFLFC